MDAGETPTACAEVALVLGKASRAALPLSQLFLYMYIVPKVYHCNRGCFT